MSKRQHSSPTVKPFHEYRANHAGASGNDYMSNFEAERHIDDTHFTLSQAPNFESCVAYNLVNGVLGDSLLI